MPLLDARNITKTFFMGQEKLNVLHDVNLSVNAGELLAITGKSGSGKSTLMHILGCLDVPTSGTYTFEGEVVSRMGPDELANIRNKKVGFVFQQFNLLEDFTALDNVALPRVYGNASEHAAQNDARTMLELVGLGDRLYHYPGQLSGGERQRVAIARGLVNDPMLILADEPTGNLDSHTGRRIMEIFSELNKQRGKTVIIVTHDHELASQTNRIVELMDGKVIADKPTRP